MHAPPFQYSMPIAPAYAVFLSLFLLPCSCRAANATLASWKCNSNAGSNAPNSTFQSNLIRMNASLGANVSSAASGFATATVGAPPDEAWGLALCRGDTTNGTDCAACLALAFADALKRCPSHRDVAVWYDRCLMYYSGRDFLAAPDNTIAQQVGQSSDNVTTGPERFERLVLGLVDALSDWAAYNSTSRYATGAASSPQGFLTTAKDVVYEVYGMVQCTPDQAPGECRRCLQGLRDLMPTLPPAILGMRILAVWCNLRYESRAFFDGQPLLRISAPAEAPPTAAEGGKRLKGAQILIIFSGVALGITIILLSTITIDRLRKGKGKTEREEPAAGEAFGASQVEENVMDTESLHFELPLLRNATANFAEENKLGDGGFGAVYKGFLPDGREIAVKRLSKTSTQGLGQLKNELILVAKLRHKNLAKLHGVCVQEKEMLLIYEYMPNRSLDTFLFDPERREQLDWGIRYNIVCGIARGLLYLHEDSQIRIIHRDLKASNILLDAEMNAKISDFGLARLFGRDETGNVTSQVVGTLGYMAPEYAVLGHLSVKLDVFSFGVLVLEIVTGRRNTDSFEHAGAETLLSYVWDHWMKGTPLELTDPILRGRCNGTEVLRCIHVGLLCVQANPPDRPTMLTVLLMLYGDTASFPAASRPAFAFGYSEVNPNGSNLDRRVAVPDNEAELLLSVNEMSITEFSAR